MDSLKSIRKAHTRKLKTKRTKSNVKQSLNVVCLKKKLEIPQPSNQENTNLEWANTLPRDTLFCGNFWARWYFVWSTPVWDWSLNEVLGYQCFFFRFVAATTNPSSRFRGCCSKQATNQNAFHLAFLLLCHDRPCVDRDDLDEEGGEGGRLQYYTASNFKTFHAYGTRSQFQDIGLPFENTTSSSRSSTERTRSIKCNHFHLSTTTLAIFLLAWGSHEEIARSAFYVQHDMHMKLCQAKTAPSSFQPDRTVSELYYFCM